MTKKSKAARPAISLPPATASLDEIVSFIGTRKSQPVARASEKLLGFVNECVRDQDFLHPQSAPLLDFLMIVRDVLCDGVNERWTLDDVLEPVVEKARRAQADARMGGLKEAGARHGAAVAWARSRARCLWEQDTEQRIRITEMACTIWGEMVCTAHMDERPETVATLKDWIKDAAPPHASRRGRARK